MIIITSEVIVKPEHWEEALEVADRHVKASRLESGCISHRYLVSPELENCLFFYEEWQDRAAIDAHFEQPYSLEVSSKLGKWASNKVKINFHTIGDQHQSAI